MASLEELEQRVMMLEAAVARLQHHETAPITPDTAATLLKRRVRELCVDQATLSAGIAKAFAAMGIVGEPIGAENVQRLVAACGFKPEENVFSRGIIDMREEWRVAHHFYLDASGLAKRYVVEMGTPLLNRLFQRVASDRLMCLSVGTLEVISILVRKKNGALLSPAAFQQAMLDFRHEVLDALPFDKLAVTDTFVSAAVPLIETHSVNATDGLILASALAAATSLRASSDELVLVSSDQRLLRAAQVEGLKTFDPETQSEAELDSLIGS